LLLISGFLERPMTLQRRRRHPYALVEFRHFKGDGFRFDLRPAPSALQQRRCGGDATPTFFINGEISKGAMSFEELDKKIRALLKK
jgi:hypothetical protein